mmetsp:Transcript_2933/g.7081  ORF Transcript_2933/g.7081 Transcript_2933/m.7081 type:complete len:279 (+) Transcript_2933:240-1076(+)
MTTQVESSHANGESDRPTHEALTAAEPREECVTEARILEIREETPTVRELVLEVVDPAFSFKPGQWVDFFIDGCSVIGGYSLCSIASELPKLRLAVKRSTHPPAAWCHSEACRAGVVVQMKAGGGFFWDSDDALEKSCEHLVLVSGGIGINPLYSIAQTVVRQDSSKLPNLRRVTLLYSAAKPSELAFRQDLEDLAASDQRFDVEFRVTRNDGAEKEPFEGPTERIDAPALRKAVFGLKTREVLAFVCGPSEMTDAIVDSLRGEVGLPEERVRCEKWW